MISNDDSDKANQAHLNVSEFHILSHDSIM